MNSGSVTARCTVLGLIVGMGIILGATVVTAQTPEEACAADSLYLISPDVIMMKQQVSGRPGLELSWPDLPTSDATCYTLTGLEEMGFSVSVEGGFGDNVDRILAFTTPDSGMVGHHLSSPLLVSWQSQGHATNGVLAGNINLANNGGVLRLDSSEGGAWGQLNSGLPMSWLATNVVALSEGSNGFMVAAFSGGSTIDTSKKGVWVFRSGVWSRLGEDLFTDSIVINQISVSPGSNDVFAVGTSRDGIYVTHDGGETFSNFSSNLVPDPNFPDMPTSFNVGLINWSSDRLLVFIKNFGLFYSNNNGNSFTASPIQVEDDLDIEDPLDITWILPQVHDITVDSNDADRILLGLNFNGVWESTDGCLSWHDLYGDLNVAIPDSIGRWVHSASSVAIDAGDSQIIVAGMVAEGLYRTADGGNTWAPVAGELQPEAVGSLVKFFIRSDPDTPGHFYALEDKYSLLRSIDSGVSWEHAANQPFIPQGLQLLVSRDGSGDLLMATYGGGIFEPGLPISLAETYNSTTSPYLRDLALGLDVTFGGGVIDNDDTFNLVCQTFQGWSVWRSPSHDPHNMTLLGMFDRVNSESCIEGYCGDMSYELVPQCYVSKRAACFNFATDDTIRFFDDEVYNGFSYNYAVATFDYGNTALVRPQNNTNSMVFSPRFPQDPNSLFVGNGNLSFVQINSGTVSPASDESIYVYPNPLRRDAGIPGSEGEMVVFTNLPPQSRVRVFTTAGDDVINLGWDNMKAGNIYWRSNNRDGEPVAPGVYLYKVEAPGREDYWGKLIVIR